MAWGERAELNDGQPALRELSPAGGEVPAPAAAASRHRGRHVLRSTLCVVLSVLGVLCLTVAPLAVWSRNLVLNTNRYVATVEPLASNTGLQDALVAAVDSHVESNLDVESFLTGVLPSGAAKALAGPIENGVSGLVNTITTEFVQSDAFHTLWVTMNRAAHEQIVKVLTGKQPANGVITVTNGTVFLDLSQIVEQVKARLIEAGLTVASNVPAVGATLEIAQVEGLTKAQSVVRALNTLANWLPWIGLGLLAAAIVAARRRRRVLIASALGLAAGMGLIGIGLLIGRHLYLSALPGTALPQDVASSVFDTLVRYLRWGIRVIFLIGVVVAVTAWATGPSRHAVALRAGATKATGRVKSGPVGAFVASYATVLRVAIVGIAIVVLLLMDSASWATLIVVGAIVVLLLASVHVLSRSAPQLAEASVGDSG